MPPADPLTAPVDRSPEERPILAEFLSWLFDVVTNTAAVEHCLAVGVVAAFAVAVALYGAAIVPTFVVLISDLSGR